MIELYQERIDRHEHEWYSGADEEWKPVEDMDFCVWKKYRIKKCPIEEAVKIYVYNAMTHSIGQKVEVAKEAFRSGWLACQKDRDNNK